MASISMGSSASSKKYVYDLLPDGDYESRICRFTGLGVQPQPAYKDRVTGTISEKKPAFKAAVQFELVGDENGNRPMATGKIFDAEGNETGIMDPRPACQFKDYFINPRAKNSGFLNLLKMIDASVETINPDLEWMNKTMMGQPVMLTIGHYTNKHGVVRNCINAINPIAMKYRKGVAEMTLEPIFFDPYEDNADMLHIYNNELQSFQRDDLGKAVDRQNIPYAGKEAVRTNQNTEQEAPVGNTEQTANSTPFNDSFEDADSPF